MGANVYFKLLRDSEYGKYCCPVNFKTAEESSPKPFRIGLRAFFFEKQAPPNQIMMVPAVGI